MTADISSGTADLFALDCSDKNGCVLSDQQEIGATGKTVVINKPNPGPWRIIARTRGPFPRKILYSVHEAVLTPTVDVIEAADGEHAPQSSWTRRLVGKQRDARYAAFRIAGNPGLYWEQNGLQIAMTPLKGDIP